jgi:ribosomal protein RSM22 (predicted rRNA methylase)
MIATLPAPLLAAIEAEASTVPPARLREAAEALSGAYRGNATLKAALSPADRAAYLAVRFPSTFAAARVAWVELANAIPLANVESVLDAGAGPGTASLAAHDLLPAATRYTWLERDVGWRTAADRLATAAALTPQHRNAALGPALALDPHDVVVAAYALNELPPAARPAVVDALWRAARRAVIILEPGTPAGFQIVRAAREAVLAQGAHAAAPCTHDTLCPMSRRDWCHRPVRVARTALHRGAKHAQLGFEDEKFSFVVLTRDPPARAAKARIVRKPMRNAGHVHLDLCNADGLERATVTRSDRETYRQARDAEWGGAWPPQDD